MAPAHEKEMPGMQQIAADRGSARQTSPNFGSKFCSCCLQLDNMNDGFSFGKNQRSCDICDACSLEKWLAFNAPEKRR